MFDPDIRAMRDAWSMTKQRCLNPRQRDYHRYGGRGITICGRWLVFENFLADMGPRPPGMTLERRNNSMGYETGNCLWAPRKAQTRNRAITLKISYEWVEKTVAEWAEITGIPYFTLKARLTRLGYTPRECLEKPVKCGEKLPGRVYTPRRIPSKLTPHQVAHVRQCAPSDSARLAAQYGVCYATIRNAQTGRTFRDAAHYAQQN